MSDLGRVLEAAGHRISGGAEYQWRCYPDARYIDVEGEHGTGSILFSTKDQTVYAVEASNGGLDHNYRWINPLFIDAYLRECDSKGINPNTAFDDTEHSDTDDFEDILVKLKAILEGEDFDTRVTVGLELSKDQLLELALEAHRQDITLNELFTSSLEAALLEAENEPTQPRCPVTDSDVFGYDGA
jgi:hypothetical protein